MDSGNLHLVEDVDQDPSMVWRAMCWAALAHADQVDKAGEPYITHPRRVAQRVWYLVSARQRRTAQAAAWLHDVVEDTTTTLDDLAEAGFPDDVLDVVDRLTRRPGQSTESYITRIRSDAIARAVKAADLIDNTDPDRLGKLDQGTRQRLAAKYARSWALLRGDAGV